MWLSMVCVGRVHVWNTGGHFQTSSMVTKSQMCSPSPSDRGTISRGRPKEGIFFTRHSWDTFLEANHLYRPITNRRRSQQGEYQSFPAHSQLPTLTQTRWTSEIHRWFESRLLQSRQSPFVVNLSPGTLIAKLIHLSPTISSVSFPLLVEMSDIREMAKGQDSMLSLPRAWVQSLVGELRSHKLAGRCGKKKKKEYTKGIHVPFNN